MGCLDAVNAFNQGPHFLPTVHVYPYCPEDPNGPARSHTQHYLDAAQALHQTAVVDGVKGP